MNNKVNTINRLLEKYRIEIEIIGDCGTVPSGDLDKNNYVLRYTFFNKSDEKCATFYATDTFDFIEKFTKSYSNKVL